MNPHRELDDLTERTMQFDIALSLGNACQTRYQLSRILQARHGRDAGGGSFFWDWQWRDSGINGVVRVLESDFTLDLHDFIPRKVGDQYEAYNNKYGIYFTHDFKLI